MEQLSSHPEVNQENPTAFEPNNQILAAAVECRDPLSLELGGHPGGVEGPGEARVLDLDALEAAPDKLRLQLSPDGLDLGQLGHGASLVPAVPLRTPVNAGPRVIASQLSTSSTTGRSGGGSSASS